MAIVYNQNIHENNRALTRDRPAAKSDTRAVMTHCVEDTQMEKLEGRKLEKIQLDFDRYR